MGRMVRSTRWAVLGCIALLGSCERGRTGPADLSPGDPGAQPSRASTAGPAQPPPGDPGAGPLAKLYTPDLLMTRQGDLGLSKAQRQAMIESLQETQSALVPLQWQMHAATGDLEKLLDAPRVDEAAALATGDRMTLVEGEIKRQHLRLLIRLKNQLTEAQQHRLDELRTRGPLTAGAASR